MNGILLPFILGLLLLSGVPSLCLSSRSDFSELASHLIHSVGSVLALLMACWVLLIDSHSMPAFSGHVGLHTLTLRLDPISAIFLLPAALVTNCASLYGLSYWRQSAGAPQPRYLRLFYGTLSAGLCGVPLAADAISFLIAWELMALSAFFLVATNQESSEVRFASLVYLVTCHVTILLLWVLFGFMWVKTGTTDFFIWESRHWGGTEAAVIFCLALFAFGLKAGVFPGHFWLPPAHASAPSHVSAVMSGVLIKMGIYGLIRVLLIILPAAQIWWGEILLFLGALSAVIGVLFALGQHDIKRLLAYHSVENIGIIMLGIGTAAVGIATAQPLVAGLGLAGGLLHVWNHALFKSLLFLAGGSVVHATQSREIDQLGGLLRCMPFTALAFLIGAVAICGLPPLNGFVSEFLLYFGFFTGLLASAGRGVIFGALALVLAGGLALACFVKVFSAVFLGNPRSSQAVSPHEAPTLMRVAMVILIIPCFAIGLFPQIVVLVLAPAVNQVMSRAELSPISFGEFRSLRMLSYSAIALVSIMGVSAFVLSRKQWVRSQLTWDCGFAFPSARMQYTASSFAQMLLHMFSFIVLPKRSNPHIEGIFPEATKFHSTVPDIVFDRTVLPALRRGVQLASMARVLQQGRTQAYILYILLTLIVALYFVISQ